MESKEPLLFSQEEWHTCLKVLRILTEHQTPASYREPVERLVAESYRKIRKKNRKESLKNRKEQDRDTLQNTGLISSAPELIPTSASQALEKKHPIEHQQIDKTKGKPEISEGSTPRLEFDGALDNMPQFRTLHAKSRRCYICKRQYRQVHFLYHLLCPACARLNYDKRMEHADLSGRYALITGGRIKIGYQVALRMLRDGAHVTVTTRFSKDALRRYSAEPDFEQWQHRLRVYSLDFRNIPCVLDFISHISEYLPWLDILVNNAAQTIRRPLEYYASVASLESSPLNLFPTAWQAILGNYPSHLPVEDMGEFSLQTSAKPAHSIPLDRYGEPIDTREQNSWTLRLHEVSLPEMLEVQLINTAVPFLLTSRLKPVLLRSQFDKRFVINVCGLDGRFDNGYKSFYHPHINMSKAALNMMTRTSAVDYADDRIFMNSVDVGWITHEGRYSSKWRMRSSGFVPPLDEIDATARIYDPIVQGIRGYCVFGKLFRHYAATAW